MAINNRLNEIKERIKEQLEWIDGSDDYNFDLTNKVRTQFVPLDENDLFPSLCIASLSTGESNRIDQVTYQIPVVVEIVGYVMDDTDPLGAILKLAMDAEKAIYSDPSLDKLVWDLRVTIEIGTLREFGVLLMTLIANTDFILQ